jgi:hypothetical protein
VPQVEVRERLQFTNSTRVGRGADGHTGGLASGCGSDAPAVRRLVAGVAVGLVTVAAVAAFAPWQVDIFHSGDSERAAGIGARVAALVGWPSGSVWALVASAIQ